MTKKYLNLDGPHQIQVAWKDNDTQILLSDQTVTLTKEFGPTIFMSIRCRPDFDRMEWVIERDCGDDWKECATVPAQLDSDFPEDTP